MRSGHFERWLPLVALAVIAAGTSWLLRISEPPREKGVSDNGNSPDMIVDRFTLQRFDASGKRQYVFSASEMRHFTQPERTELVQPELLFLGGEAPVRAEARKGTVSADGERVQLEGEVMLSRSATQLRAAATLQTEALTVWPESERVAGVVPVRYSEGDDELVAGSFSADNMAEALELGDGVTATFTR